MPKFNRRKFEQAILYFAKHVPPEYMGKMKLLKLLYYLDFDHFEKHGKPVTGETYLRFSMGPFPKHANRIIDELVKSGKLDIRKEEIRKEGYKDREVPRSLVEPDTSVFSATELETLEDVLSRFKYWTGNQMKIATHGEAPWLATEEDQEIDYRLAPYRDSWGVLSAELAEEHDPFVDAMRESGFFERATEEITRLGHGG